MLEQKFLNYIKTQKLFYADNKILLTVSGGVDSMVMLHLFRRTNFEVGIAHCNFNLRGDESDRDANFVRLIARENAIPYFEESFDTGKFASDRKCSIQEAARELRYSWFEEIKIGGNYQYYATGHNFDDQLETFFINLFRGTGVRGLRGILPKNGNCIRPLLFATRDEIVEYAKNHNIVFREDSSNKSDKYLRNRIRHQLLPALQSVKSDFKTGFEKTFTHLLETEKVIEGDIRKLREKLFSNNEDQIRIPIDKLTKLQFIEFYLHELLKPFNFNEDVTGKIPAALNKIPGKTFFSKTHQLIIDRDFLIISPVDINKPDKYFVDAGAIKIGIPVELNFERLSVTGKIIIDPDKNVAQFDFDKLKFPLKLRRWEEGDSFHPFGMRGRKKVSDYFTDNKFSLLDKQKTWILLSEDKIAWIVGHRIDDRFKIDNQTKTIYKISLIANS